MVLAMRVLEDIFKKEDEKWYRSGLSAGVGC